MEPNGFFPAMQPVLSQLKELGGSLLPYVFFGIAAFALAQIIVLAFVRPAKEPGKRVALNVWAVALAGVILCTSLAAGGVSGLTAGDTGHPDETPSVTPTVEPTMTPEPSLESTLSPTSGYVIRLATFTSELPNVIDRYLDLHPAFGFRVVPFYPAESYEPFLDEALAAGTVDLYCAESAFVTKYTQGDMARYAMPYSDLGLDVSKGIDAAKIAQYIVDIGTRPGDNKLVGLAYQSTGSALIYRRSLAKATWGTDDPAAVQAKVGPGWDKFFAAAADLKAKGYVAVSSQDDIWHSVENSADRGWLVGGKLTIDPKREAFLDLAKKLSDNGYSNNTQSWTDAWYTDMSGAGARPVFSFFGPAWLINYVMEGHCGGKMPKGTYGDWAVCMPPAGFFWGGTWVLANKDTLSNDPDKKAAVKELIDWITLDCSSEGLQSAWANGAYGEQGVKDTPASAAVMAVSDGSLDFLGGQNMFDVLIPANLLASGRNVTQFDGTIDAIWNEQARLYASGKTTRSQAIADFKKAVKAQLGIDAA